MSVLNAGAFALEKLFVAYFGIMDAFRHASTNYLIPVIFSASAWLGVNSLYYIIQQKHIITSITLTALEYMDRLVGLSLKLGISPFQKQSIIMIPVL